MLPIRVALLLINLIVAVLALPTKQLRYSLMVEREFHFFNQESVFLKDDLLLIDSTKETGIEIPQEDLFSALFDKTGQFHLTDKTLHFSDSGNLELTHDNNFDNDDKKAKSIFSIKDGKLCHDSVCYFTLCPAYNIVGPDSSAFSIHHPHLDQANCEGKIKNIELVVLNQIGMKAKDFEAPEFLYDQGHRKFL